MPMYTLSYREVACYQILADAWREITLNTGGTQSTLQDIKVLEKANGYCYKDATKFYTRNRFIFWHTNHDILELVEQSLDVNLSGNRIRYRFVDTPILDGITIYETSTNVIILVPTVCSVHRLVFPHPNRLHKHEFISSHPDLTTVSIFAEATTSEAKDSKSFYVFVSPTSSHSQLPHAAASCLTLDDEALFILVYPSSDILLVRQNVNGHCQSIELKYDSVVPRFLSGLAEKFRSKSADSNLVLSVVLHSVNLETYAIALCRDGHIRVWSCSKAQCIAVSDILGETGENGRELLQGSQNHMLRKTVSDPGSEFLLAAYVCFSTTSRFHILKPVIDGSQFRIIRLHSLYAPDGDLVDYVLTSSRIWSVWRVEGECTVYSAQLTTKDARCYNWVPVLLEPLPDVNQPPEDSSDKDPRQLYLQHIFQPGSFPIHVIQKALSIYKRSNLLSDVNLSIALLKQRVCMAVENEIQSELKEFEVSDEDYLECAYRCWAKFFSCCVQYHIADLKPLGLLLLPSVSGAVLLKKASFSILRPMDALEHLMLCSEYSTVEQFADHPSLSEDLTLTEDVIKLIQTLVYFEQQMSEFFSSAFEKELSQLKSPDVVMNDLLIKIKTEMGFEFTEQIKEMLMGCENLYRSIHKLLELLRIDYVNATEPTGFTIEVTPSVGHLFSSQLGISFVSRSLHQQAVVRFMICRDLLAVQNIHLEKSDGNSTEEAIRSVCALETVVLTQATYAFRWLTSLPCLPHLPLEPMLQRLAPLKLPPVYNLRSSNLQSISLIELFVGSTGGFAAHKMLQKECNEENSEDFPHWHCSLLKYIMQLSYLIWPITNSSTIFEWLLSTGQNLWLQQHVRLLSNWCEWNSCTRDFLLAVSLLGECEFYKAEQLFLTVTKGVYTDQFLMSRFQMSNQTLMMYYLKVIQLFELHNSRDCAINVASAALSIADQADPHRATLYSIKFKHHLALRHYDMAFDSLNSNPDHDRKNDNLRDLVKTLLDQKQFHILLKYDYGVMEEQFREILIARARATDAIDNPYYDFLYAYYIIKGTVFLRLAASVMYEQAYRLSESNIIEALEKQVKCYLAAKNALCLCEEKFRWVTRPVPLHLSEQKVVLPPEAGSQKAPITFIAKKTVEPVDVEMLQKELKFALGRLQLVKFESRFLTSHLTDPTELIMLLSSCGLYKPALVLCKTFDLPYGPVIDLLTRRCIILTRRDDPEAWRWLMENDIQDLTTRENSPSTVAWKLLENYICTYEKEGLTELHHTVCKRLITMKCSLPYWLYASYRAKNPAELLRLFYHSGRLDEAILLTKDYILAAMGHGKEHFGLKNSLLPTAPSLCLPVYKIASLIKEIELQNGQLPEKPLEQECVMLKELFQEYLQTSQRITNEVCRH